MNNYKILTLDKNSLWNTYISKLPLEQQDIYYTPDYYEIYEKNNDGKALCFVFEEGNHLALYPFLLNRINDLGYDLDESYYDIQGAYGYNGVVYSSYDSEFIKSFYNEFSKFCKENNIVAEFTRFNPLLDNYKFSKNYLDVSYNRKTVYVDLTKKYIDIYNNYSTSMKRNLMKAKKNNLSFEVYKNEFPMKKDFVEMYKETMDRAQAERYLYFNDVYFDSTFRNSQLVQFVIFKDKAAIASAICFCSNFYIHFHLSASKKEYLELRPNNLLKDTIISYGNKNGFRKLHLGGGKSSSEDDSLLRFKLNFSKSTTDFFIGKKIHNVKIYNKICEQWNVKYPHLTDKYENLLTKYRFFN